MVKANKQWETDGKIDQMKEEMDEKADAGQCQSVEQEDSLTVTS